MLKCRVSKPVVEPEPVVKDPNVVQASEIASILNGTKPVEATPFSFESNPDTTEAAAEESDSEKNSAWGENLFDEDTSLQRRTFNRPNGFVDPNDLSQPAIWTEKYGRGIKLSD